MPGTAGRWGAAAYVRGGIPGAGLEETEWPVLWVLRKAGTLLSGRGPSMGCAEPALLLPWLWGLRQAADPLRASVISPGNEGSCACLCGLLRGLNKIMHVKHLAYF